MDTCLQIQDEFLNIHTAYTQLHIHAHVYLHIQACACCTNIYIHACIMQNPNMHTHACSRQITCTYEYTCGAAQMYIEIYTCGAAQMYTGIHLRRCDHDTLQLMNNLSSVWIHQTSFMNAHRALQPLDTTTSHVYDSCARTHQTTFIQDVMCMHITSKLHMHTHQVLQPRHTCTCPPPPSHPGPFSRKCLQPIP